MTPEAILYLLEKEHPQTFQAIQARLKGMLPAYVFTDYGQVPDIIRFYCQAHQISIASLQGTATRTQEMDRRKELLCLLVLCYQPEKLYGLSKAKTRGLIGHMATLLHCNRPSLSRSLPEVMFYFAKQKSFREPILALHRALLEQYTTQAG
jgi:hypothetical protein